MPIELKMPALSPTMEKGTLAKWLVGVGDTVKSGDLLAEIETDKATMEFEAIDEGIIASIMIAEGTDDVAVGTVIATLVEEGEAAVPSTPVSPVEVTPEPVPPIVTPVQKPDMPAPMAATPAVAPASSAPVAVDETANASPLARRIAAAQGIALASITGSGPRGRIVKADLGLSPQVAPAPAPTLTPSAVAAPATTVYDPPTGVPHSSVKLSGMRKTIARRLAEAKQTIPHFYLTVRCQLDALLALRAVLNADLASRGVKLSVNDFLIKALAEALREIPDANVQYGGDVLYRFERADIAMAVAIDGGLITPVIRDAGALSLSAIARASIDLATRARAGTLSPKDYAGGTASISNLGMYGIDEMIPVINPPQALILGVGAGVEQPWKVDGGIALATIMAATASFDHRAIDGAVGAQFMSALRDLIETPIRLCC
jgi:pyruvate dehydrogenase E2 component (dihydrolipoamide acetyltransferase)